MKLTREQELKEFNKEQSLVERVKEQVKRELKKEVMAEIKEGLSVELEYDHPCWESPRLIVKVLLGGDVVCEDEVRV